MIKTFNYSGNKKHIIPHINAFILKSQPKIYFEPFLGSGIIFSNLEYEFDEYHINDLTKDVYDIFQSIIQYTYDDFKDFWFLIHDQFGDIKQNKEAFYEFRNWFNKTFYFIESCYRGIGLYILTNSVINSYMRVGPHGVNTCFGKRKRFFSENEFDHLKSRLLRANLTNIDASILFDKFVNDKEVFSFLDPPYYEAPICYNNDSDINITLLTQEYCLNSQGHIVYTDIYSDKRKEMFKSFNIIPIKRKLGSNRTLNKKTEAIYTNIS